MKNLDTHVSSSPSYLAVNESLEDRLGVFLEHERLALDTPITAVVRHDRLDAGPKLGSELMVWREDVVAAVASTDVEGLQGLDHVSPLNIVGALHRSLGRGVLDGMAGLGADVTYQLDEQITHVAQALLQDDQVTFGFGDFHVSRKLI
jgi:hypothetical protein